MIFFSFKTTKKKRQNDVVQANLMGISRKMKDKNWTDSQGRKGKGYGVYRFADKYGVSLKQRNFLFFFPGFFFLLRASTQTSLSHSSQTLPSTPLQANVDGYSPIYTPDTWSESGGSYKLGTKGLVAWAGLIAVLLAVGANLIISTSQIGS